MKGEFNMPKFDDYTQKSTPEDTDLMLLLDKTENANKKVLFSGIWNWIVKKLAEAVIEKLQTSDKTIIGALNELNSKILIGENKRYIKVVSDNSNVNWGGILLVTMSNILLVSINGNNAPKIAWVAIPPTKTTVSSGENNPLETIIDTTRPDTHFLAIPFGLISKSLIAITN